MEYSLWSYLVKTLVAAAAVSFGGASLLASATQPGEEGLPQPLKLVVLLNYHSNGLPRAEELVEVLERGQGVARGQLIDHLGNPAHGKLLIEHRISADARKQLAEDHPQELLHRYVVLEYPTTQATMAAKARLERDPDVLYVEESKFARFAVAPADPLYANTGGAVSTWQWGINDPIGLQAAWDNVRGTAFLADLDNGIQVLHEDFAEGPYRRFLYNVAGGTDVDENPTANSGLAGHGTHTAGIMASATSQTSVATGYPNPTNRGVAGVCWYCSLLIAKISRGGMTDWVGDVPNAINWAIGAGAQVLNMSFEAAAPTCDVNPTSAFCVAIEFAARRHVVFVGAAGNSNASAGGNGFGLGTTVAFPANHDKAIAAGAIQSYSGSRGNLWTEETPQQYFYGSSTGSAMTAHGILAPGRDVLSTFYDSRNWNPSARCGFLAATPRYGPCTGTSMAAPHITGIVGLMRSVNPLLDATSIRSMLLSSGDNAGAPNATRGFGVVNASAAVASVLNATNRLTPLFSLYNGLVFDHFYTVVPQQARAAFDGLLMPATNPTSSYFATIGTTTAEYTDWPDPPYFYNPAARPLPPPRAQVWVFSTHRNPFNPSVELLPLWRMSWKCGDAGPRAICSTTPDHVSHVYSASLSEVWSLGGAGNALDGIEGYVLPLGQPQPAGTTVLWRAYNSARDDYMLYPTEDQTLASNEGYTSNATQLGYVFRNSGSRPSY